jgi:hypothetical protein
MSTTPDRTSGTSDLDQLTARLDELQRRTEGLTAALEKTRSTRRLIMLAFLAFVVIVCWRFYSLSGLIQSPDYQNRLLTEVQKAVESNQDTFSKQAELLVDEATPVISAAFSEQSKKDMPVFMGIIDRERALLLENLAERMEKKVLSHHDKLVHQHEKLFAEEFPAVQDKETRERMIGNTAIALDRLIKKYYVDEFKKEFQLMEKTWDEFPPADKPTGDEPPLESQLVGELMDLLAIKFSRSHGAAASN